MIIKKAILHIMDFNSDICVFSQKELDTSDYGTGEFIDKHLTKIVSDGARREGSFMAENTFVQSMKRYLSQEINFTEFSNSAATLIYDELSRADELKSLDVLMCQFTDEANEYIGVLLLENKIEYTHLVEKSEEGPFNKIIRHFTLLPNTNQSIGSYAIIRLSDQKIFLRDKKRSINGEDVEILPEKVLMCDFKSSERDVIKTIKKVTDAVASEYGANSAVAVSRAKSFIIEAAEQDVPFTPSDISEGIFYDNEVMKKSFNEKAMEAGLAPKISVDNPKVVKSIRTHKIKTDTGIEISIPTEYLENSRYIEFINNPDGTISIQLKHIGKIVNR